MAKGKGRSMDEVLEELKAFDKMIEVGEEKYFDTDDLDRIILGYILNRAVEKAHVALEYAKKLHHGTVVFLIYEGMILHLLERNKEAIEVLNRAELIYPKDFMLFKTRASCYFQIQEKELGMAEIEKSNEIGFDFKAAFGIVDEPEKITMSKKMVDMDPLELFNAEREKYSSDYETLKEISDNFGFAFGEKGLEVINFFKKIADDNPSSADRWMFLGLSYDTYRRFPEAIEAYALSISLNPDNAICYNRIARAYSLIHKYEDAIINYRLSIDYSKPTDDYFYPREEDERTQENIPFMYYWIGTCYKQLRHYNNAEFAYRKFNELDPEDDGSWYSIGEALMKQGLYKESVPYFKKAIEIDKEYSGYVYCLYAYALFKSGDMKKAQKAFDRILKDKYPSDGFYKYYPQFLWAMDKQEEAFEILQKGINQNPVVSEFFYIKALFYYRSDNRTEGNKFLNTALKLKFDDHYLLFEYAPEQIGR